MSLACQFMFADKVHLTFHFVQGPIAFAGVKEINAQSWNNLSSVTLFLPIEGKRVEVITTEINHGIYLILYPFAQPTLCILIDGMESIPAARRIAGSVTVFTYGAGTDLYPGFQSFYTFIEMTDDFCDIIPAPLGKVASFTVLPEMLDCREFVNADEIAAGLSPFNPEGVAIQAGRLMIERIIHLLKEGETFAFETTLATRSYVKLIKQAQKRGYFVTLLFFSLSSPEQAVKRVAKRVSEGGHNIPLDVIYRRYDNGLSNLFNLYMPVCDYWALYDNSTCPANKIAYGCKDESITIIEPAVYEKFKDQYTEENDNERG